MDSAGRSGKRAVQRVGRSPPDAESTGNATNAWLKCRCMDADIISSDANSNLQERWAPLAAADAEERASRIEALQ